MAENINYSTEKLASEFTGRSHVRMALEEIKEQFDLCKKVIIELGCGLGNNLEIFSQDNDVIGYEGLEDATVAANQRGIRVLQANLDEPPFSAETGSADVVLCVDVLEHLDSPELCVKESWRILRDNGLLIVNVPNHFTMSGRLRILFGSGIDSNHYFPSNEDWNNPHIRFFRHQTIMRLITKNGFTMVEDWSGKFPAVPGLNRLPGINQTGVPYKMARWLPNLFAGGFFLIARKSVIDSDTQ